jgi:hypothetical protein
MQHWGAEAPTIMGWTGTVNLVVADERKSRRVGGSGGQAATAAPVTAAHTLKFCAGGSVLVGGDVIAAEMEEVVDRLVCCQESLRLPRGPEPLHLALSPSGGVVRVFGPVVQPLVPTVLDRSQEILLCRGIAGELVGDHHPRRSPLPLQELARSLLRNHVLWLRFVEMDNHAALKSLG